MIEKTRSGKFTLQTKKKTGASRQQNNKKRRKISGTKKKDLLAAKKNLRKRSVGKTRRRRERREGPSSRQEEHSEANRREEFPEALSCRKELTQLVDNFTHHDDVRIPDAARKEPDPDKKTSKNPGSDSASKTLSPSGNLRAEPSQLVGRLPGGPKARLTGSERRGTP